MTKELSLKNKPKLLYIHPNVAPILTAYFADLEDKQTNDGWGVFFDTHESNMVQNF